MELKFDEMEVDTTLAQKYLMQNDFSKLWVSDATLYFDGALTSTLNNFPRKQCTEISHNLQNLAVLLKENVNLFTQLEFSIRNISIEDTKAQINLIIQQLYYLSFCDVNKISTPSLTDVTRGFKHSRFSMSQKTPLLELGFVVRAFVYLRHSANMLCLIASKETTALCYLFTKLCHDAGLPVVTRFGGVPEEYHAGNETLGTVGVISESSDVDSAVDVFLTSSKQAPWRLRRILVQESVYKQFKDALTWKCNLNISGKTKSTGESSSDDFRFNDRVFLIDAIDISDPQPSEVVIEAYRTIKELLSLLKQYRPHYVSLWANDIGEINEVTHSILSQVVWVNNFADFRGPPRISESIYSNRSYQSCNEYLLKKEERELFELQSSWLKLNIQTRCEILSNTLDEKAAEQSDNHFYTEIKDAFRRAQLYASGTFVDVGKDYVCLGVPVTSDKIHVYLPSTPIFNEAFFKLVLRGNAFIIKSVTPEISLLIDSFKKAGLPVSGILPSDSEDNIYTPCHSCNVMFEFSQGTRVIWTNSGTIFAN